MTRRSRPADVAAFVRGAARIGGSSWHRAAAARAPGRARVRGALAGHRHRRLRHREPAARRQGARRRALRHQRQAGPQRRHRAHHHPHRGAPGRGRAPPLGHPGDGLPRRGCRGSLVAALSEPLTDPLLAAITVRRLHRRRRLRRCGSCCRPPIPLGRSPAPGTLGRHRRGGHARLGPPALPAGRGRGRHRLHRGRHARPQPAGGPSGRRHGRHRPAGGDRTHARGAHRRFADVVGITPVVTPNESFYRIDTALVTPRVNVTDWQLTVKGLVDREVRLTYQQLSDMPLFEQFVTIACVSNEVGGRLVGNALWKGVDLRAVLDMAGVQPQADQIVGRSVDGFTVLRLPI